jgi:curved DNA-binding protein
MRIKPGERDHYRVLGVPPDASTREIRRAYRRLARQHHPDITRQPGDGDYFTALTTAYEILHDPAKRTQYDHDRYRHSADARDNPTHGRECPRWAQPGSAVGSPGVAARTERGRDRRAVLELSAREAAQLALGTITVQAGDYRIRLPAGIRAGQQIRLVGAGEPGWLGGPPGDLLLTVAMPSSRLTRTGASLIDLLLAPAAISTSPILFSEGRFVWP